MKFICKKCYTITEGKVLVPEKSNFETLLVITTIILMVAHLWVTMMVILSAVLVVSTIRWARLPLACEHCSSQAIAPVGSEAGKELIERLSSHRNDDNVLPFRRNH